MTEHVSGDFNRRDFLKGALGGGIALALGSQHASNVPPSEETLLLDAIDDFEGYQPVYETAPEADFSALPTETEMPRLTYTDRSNLTVASNPRLTQPIPNPGYAYAVTHPGFAEVSISNAQHFLSNPNSKEFKEWFDTDRRFYRYVADLVQGGHGDYKAHLGNLIQLYDAFEQTDVPVLCFYETSVLDEPSRLRPEFALPKHAFALGTLAADGALSSVVNIRNPQSTKGYNYELQQPDTLFDNLRHSGVTEIRVAGEYGFDPIDTDPACLGSTSLQLTAQGFHVRGIAGAVFPPEPPAKPDNPQLARNLFDRAIPMDQALADL
jgi:hypothetical protein